MFIVNSNNIIVAIADQMEIVENGILVGDTVFGERDLILVDEPVPEGTEIQKHKYINGKFENNPFYVPPEKSKDEIIAELQTEVQMLRTEKVEINRQLVEAQVQLQEAALSGFVLEKEIR